MDFWVSFKEKTEKTDLFLDKYLHSDKNVPQSIIEAMRYSVFAGGKRIRPVLMMAVYELFGKNTDDIMPFACALEMIHTYSLIHDDLPAMDNSDLRRGKKTNHVVFGEAMAVLAGDALLNYAFETMLLGINNHYQRAAMAAGYMASCSGIGGMIGGQVIDIESEGKQIDKKTLRELHKKKTSALIRAAAVCGAMLGGGNENDVKHFEEYALNLGLAFQIKDDILDVEGDAAKLGKPVGGDDKLGKNTYVTLYGIDEAKNLLLSHTRRAKEILVCYGKKAEFLNYFTEYLLNRTK